jgi:hypothetical protein
MPTSPYDGNYHGNWVKKYEDANKQEYSLSTAAAANTRSD